MRKSPLITKTQNRKQTVRGYFTLILFSLCFLVSTTVTVAQIMPQEEPLSDAEKQEIALEGKKAPPEWFDKVHYGGNIWGGFFGAFYVDVAPMAGYEVTNAGTIAGVGATFVYQGQWQGNNNSLAVGPRLFVRQPLFRSFFAHLEYELVNANEDQFYSFFDPQDPTFVPQRKWEGSPLIGLGFYQGRNQQQGGSFISVMYNLGSPNRGFISPQGIGGNNSPIVLRLGFFI